MKTKAILAILLLSLCGMAYAHTVKIMGKASYFYPQEEAFRDIYEGGLRYGGEIEVAIWKGIGIWLGGDYFFKKGELTFTKEKTSLWIIPAYFGLKFRLPEKSVSPYFGLGAGYFFFKEDNPIGKVDEGKIGGIAQLGFTFSVGGPIFFDLQFTYTYCEVKPSGVKAQLGGLQGGVGLGFQF
ncbi:MAG: hypothetical protein JXB26_14965 [Candidatus Aminicenantes bacterium]|nr:hypothetical protein [Candidatus Aminicenantes bacterium]